MMFCLRSLRILCVGLVLFCPNFLAANDAPHSLRDAHLDCGVYFSDQVGTHGVRAGNLNAADLDQILQDPRLTHDDMLRLVLVGVSPADAPALGKLVREKLQALGHKNIPITVIRRLVNFIAEETGVFVSDDGAQWKKLTANDAAELREKLKQRPELAQKQFLVVGLPTFGQARQEVTTALAEQGVQDPQIESRWLTYLKKAFAKPVVATSHAMRRAQFFLPIREDWVTPTSGEYWNALQKILIPGVVTFSIMWSNGQPLSVLIPVTLINAVNSFGTGSFRVSVANWFRRSTSFFPDQWLKTVAFSSFFTANIYWAGRGSLSSLADVLSVAGWQNFVSSKWLSVMFQTMWRAPLQSAVIGWEEARSLTATPEESLRIRQSAAAVDKYVSYVMTQFYLFSLVTHQKFFDVAFSWTNGFRLLPPEQTLNFNESTLMEVNIGHVAMASVGVMAFFLMKHMRLVDGLAAAAVKLDDAENRFVSWLGSPFRWLFGMEQQQKGAGS